MVFHDMGSLVLGSVTGKCVIDRIRVGFASISRVS